MRREDSAAGAETISFDQTTRVVASMIAADWN
jgi:hypothetical protein